MGKPTIGDKRKVFVEEDDSEEPAATNWFPTRSPNAKPIIPDGWLPTRSPNAEPILPDGSQWFPTRAPSKTPEPTPAPTQNPVKKTSEYNVFRKLLKRSGLVLAQKDVAKIWAVSNKKGIAGDTLVDRLKAEAIVQAKMTGNEGLSEESLMLKSNAWQRLLESAQINLDANYEHRKLEMRLGQTDGRDAFKPPDDAGETIKNKASEFVEKVVNNVGRSMGGFNTKPIGGYGQTDNTATGGAGIGNGIQNGETATRNTIFNVGGGRIDTEIGVNENGDDVVTAGAQRVNATVTGGVEAKIDEAKPEDFMDTEEENQKDYVEQSVLDWIQDGDDGVDTINGPVQRLNDQYNVMRYGFECDWPRPLEIDDSPFTTPLIWRSSQTDQMMRKEVESRINNIANQEMARRHLVRHPLTTLGSSDILEYQNPHEMLGLTGRLTHLEEHVQVPGELIYPDNQMAGSELKERPFRNVEKDGWREEF